MAFCQALGFPVATSPASITQSGAGGGIPLLRADDSDGGAAASGAGKAYGDLVAMRKSGYMGFPTEFDAAMAATLEKAIARQARERERAEAEEAAAEQAKATAAAGSIITTLIRKLTVATKDPQALVLAAAGVIFAYLFRRGIRQRLLRMRRGGGDVVGSGQSMAAAVSRMSSEQLRAMRKAHFDKLASAEQQHQKTAAGSTTPAGGSQGKASMVPVARGVTASSFQGGRPRDDSDDSSGVMIVDDSDDDEGGEHDGKED